MAFLELFKLCMACMLTISTPQLCPGGKEYYDGYRETDMDCTFYDNIYYPLLTRYEVFVLVFLRVNLCILF